MENIKHVLKVNKYKQHSKQEPMYYYAHMRNIVNYVQFLDTKKMLINIKSACSFPTTIG